MVIVSIMPGKSEGWFGNIVSRATVQCVLPGKSEKKLSIIVSRALVSRAAY